MEKLTSFQVQKRRVRCCDMVDIDRDLIKWERAVGTVRLRSSRIQKIILFWNFCIQWSKSVIEIFKIEKKFEKISFIISAEKLIHSYIDHFWLLRVSRYTTPDYFYENILFSRFILSLIWLFHDVLYKFFEINILNFFFIIHNIARS